MSFRYRIIVIAIGLILSGGLSYAQPNHTPNNPILESKPVPQAGQEQSTPAGNQNAIPEKTRTPDLESALNRIEAAIRDLISEDDKINRQREEDREIRDLEAQTNMAYWAKLMFWAALVTVILTAIGVILIRRTLHYTAEAAQFAAATLKEAENTTAAAIETVEVTRDLGRAQVRAYVGIKHCEIKIADGRARGTLLVVNSGQTPAHMVGFDYVLKFMDRAKDSAHLVATAPTLTKGSTGWRIESPIRANTHVPAGSEVKPYREIDLTKEQIEKLESGTAHIVMTGDMEYIDVFKRTWVSKFQFVSGGEFPFVRNGKMFASKYNSTDSEKTEKTD